MALNQMLHKLKRKKMVNDDLNIYFICSLFFFVLIAPDSSPLNLNVELESVTSLSIKWEPPPMNKTNGIILGYKVRINSMKILKLF